MSVINDKLKSIIDSTNEYRDCSRSLWNRFFMERFISSQDWSLVDSFKVIKNELFKSIVLGSELENDNSSFFLGKPSRLIKVKLADNYTTRVRINRTKNESAGYWDHPLTELDSKVTLLFVDFFDWNPYGFLDMTLIMAEVVSSPDRPEVEGHRLLVESSYVDILLDLTVSD